MQPTDFCSSSSPPSQSNPVHKFLAILGSESHEGKATTATSAPYAQEHAKAPLPLRSDQALPHAIESLDFTSGTNLNTEQDDIGVRCSLLR